MIVEWFLVKKYFLPASNDQLSLSDSCWNPACFNRLFDSATAKRMNTIQCFRKDPNKWNVETQEGTGGCDYRRRGSLSESCWGNRRGRRQSDPPSSSPWPPSIDEETPKTRILCEAKRLVTMWEYKWYKKRPKIPPFFYSFQPQDSSNREERPSDQGFVPS